MRKLEDFGCGCGLEEIDTGVMDDCLLAADRKTIQDEFKAEANNEAQRAARNVKINDLVKKLAPKLKKSQRKPGKVHMKCAENEKAKKRWWQHYN